MDDKCYYLKWNQFQSNIFTALEDLHFSEEFADVTLFCEGSSFKAHKVILSACSLYFKSVFKEHPACIHPIIILKGVNAEDLTSLLQFMYQGEVNIHRNRLPDFMRTAQFLQIRGLIDTTAEDVLTAQANKSKHKISDLEEIFAKRIKYLSETNTTDSDSIDTDTKSEENVELSKKHDLQQQTTDTTNSKDLDLDVEGGVKVKDEKIEGLDKDSNAENFEDSILHRSLKGDHTVKPAESLVITPDLPPLQASPATTPQQQTSALTTTNQQESQQTSPASPVQQQFISPPQPPPPLVPIVTVKPTSDLMPQNNDSNNKQLSNSMNKINEQHAQNLRNKPNNSLQFNLTENNDSDIKWKNQLDLINRQNIEQNLDKLDKLIITGTNSSSTNDSTILNTPVGLASFEETLSNTLKCLKNNPQISISNEIGSGSSDKSSSDAEIQPNRIIQPQISIEPMRVAFSSNNIKLEPGIQSSTSCLKMSNLFDQKTSSILERNLMKSKLTAHAQQKQKTQYHKFNTTTSTNRGTSNLASTNIKLETALSALRNKLNRSQQEELPLKSNKLKYENVGGGGGSSASPSTPIIPQTWNCPHCVQIYNNQSALKYHVRLMHSDFTNRLCCYLCPNSFTMRESYKVHMLEAHGIRH